MLYVYRRDGAGARYSVAVPPYSRRSTPTIEPVIQPGRQVFRAALGALGDGAHMAWSRIPYPPFHGIADY